MLICIYVAFHIEFGLEPRCTSEVCVRQRRDQGSYVYEVICIEPGVEHTVEVCSLI